MAWVKKPYYTKAGKRRYAVGYKDHDGVERTRGGFTRVGQARKWGEELEDARLEGRLADFLLDRQPPATPLTVHDLVLAFLRAEASEYAPPTVDNYRSVHNAQIRPRVGAEPASKFEHAHEWEALRRELRADGLSAGTIAKVQTVLSAAYTWARKQPDVPISANGMHKVPDTSRRRRRSARQQTTKPRRGAARAAWALSAEDAELIRLELRARKPGNGRPAWYAPRDVAIVTIEYGLGWRPEEVFGAPWRVLNAAVGRVEEVLSYGTLEAPKTIEHTTTMRSWVWEDLLAYRDTLDYYDLPCGDDDMVVPGVGVAYDADGELVSEGHLSKHQAHAWGRKNFNWARTRLAQRAGKGYMDKAVPYSLRRGHISARLYAGDEPHEIASDCGTSARVIFDHYAWELSDRKGKPPVPFNELVLGTREQLGSGIRTVPGVTLLKTP